MCVYNEEEKRLPITASPLKGILERDKFSIKTHTRKKKDKCSVKSPETPMAAPALPLLGAGLLAPDPSPHIGCVRAAVWPVWQQPRPLLGLREPARSAPDPAQAEAAPGTHAATELVAADVTPTRVPRDES